MRATEVTASFRSWVGVPWVHQGRTRHGIDCAGLVVVTLRDLGLLPGKFEDPTAYGREPQARMTALVDRWCRKTAVPREGTLILLRWSRDQEPSHLAYCTGRNIVHAYSRTVGGPAHARQRGGVVEHRYGEPWLRQTVQAYAIPGVEYT